MLHDQPSKTLLRPAVLRAAHMLIDDPQILSDPLAVGLIPEASADAIRPQIAEFRSPRIALVRSAFVLRSVFAERCIVRAASEGVEQLVILGAGLETFPWRQSTIVRAMRIFVTDHPASAAHAQAIRNGKGWSNPRNVTLLGLDLERRCLVEDLKRNGFNPESPAIFTMLGLSQYLTRGTIEHIARAVAKCALSSRLVMTFNPPAADLDGLDRELAFESPDRSAAFSEPWLFQPTVKGIIELLRVCELSHVSLLPPELAQVHYFAGRTDGLRAPNFEQMLEATVAGT